MAAQRSRVGIFQWTRRTACALDLPIDEVTSLDSSEVVVVLRGTYTPQTLASNTLLLLYQTLSPPSMPCLLFILIVLLWY